jgi:hypothetical protein
LFEEKLKKVSAYSLVVPTLAGTNVWEDPHQFWKYEWEVNHGRFDAWAR